jgi:hypothetical protein
VHRFLLITLNSYVRGDRLGSTATQGMRRLRVRIMQASCAALAAGVFALTAWGTATPTSPPPGAVVRSSHPIFKWTLPPGERSESIYIASKPDTTPEGKFYDENVVESDFFFSTDDPREWSPTSPLYAGRRWWIVGSRNNDFDTFFSAPREFTIPPTATIASVTVRRYSFLRNLDFTVRWRSNARRPVVTASISTLRGKRLWSKGSVEYASIGQVGSSYFSWYASRRVRKGSFVRFRATVLAQGARATVTRKLRAP